MKKIVMMIFIFALVNACTEPSSSIPSAIYPEESFLQLEPYPVIEINPSSVVTGTFRPGEISDRIIVMGFENDFRDTSVFQFEAKDTLSQTDVIPYDNIFRFEINSMQFPVSENFIVIVKAYAGDQEVWVDSLANIVTVANTKPQITSLEMNDTLNSDPQTWDWSIKVLDPDPGEQLRVDIYAEYSSGWAKVGEYSESFALSGLFEIHESFDSTARIGLQGPTRFKFIVYDNFQNFDEDTLTSWVFNYPPRIENYVFPDTLRIFEGTISYSNYYIRVSDSETLADIDSVNTVFYRPDNSISIIVDWFNDLGIDEDEFAGDGWFTAKIQNPNNPERAGTWTLQIYARDKFGNKSQVHTTTLILRN